MEWSISIIALVISIASLLWQLWVDARTRRENLVAQNLLAMAELERTIADCPSAFQFHGVPETEIEKRGFSAKELSYLLSNMTIGGIFHRMVKTHKLEYFPPASYRYELCKSNRVRDAWPLIEPLLTESIYKRQLVNTLRKIHGSTFVERLDLQ